MERVSRRTRVVVVLLAALSGLALVSLIGFRVWRWRWHKDDSPAAQRRHLPARLLIINAHEHAQGRQAIPRLIEAMDQLGIAKTVVCAGSTITTLGVKGVGFVGYDQNNQEMLAAARAWPERLVPFVTLNPTDSDNIERLERWIRKGAKGVKLYSGHGTFHQGRPLDHPGMMPVYKWLADHRVPVLWHVNTGLYLDELRRVLDQVPGLRLDCPHHCMSTEHPETVRQLLEDYPNLSVDLSHGFHIFMADALRRISASRAAFRALYDQFPDRFFWGSDTVVTLHPRKDAAWIEDMMGAYFGLYGAGRFRLPIFDEAYRKLRDEWHPGLALPEPLLTRFFRRNAERWLGVEAQAVPVPRAGWPAWANDPDRVGLEEALAQKDWSALGAAANRLACSSELDADIRRLSADALRRVVRDPRVPAPVAIGLARGLPGTSCLEPEDWQAVRTERGPGLVMAARALLLGQLARQAFSEMQATLADLAGAELRLDDADARALLARLAPLAEAARTAGELPRAYRALLVARMIRPDAPGVVERLGELQPRIEQPLIVAQQRNYSDLQDGIGVAIERAGADRDGLWLQLGVRNRLDTGIWIEAAGFTVQGADSRSATGEPADEETAAREPLEVGASELFRLRFRLPPQGGPYVLRYRKGGGKKFVVTE